MTQLSGSKNEEELIIIEADTHPLMDATRAEIDAWVDQNVTNMTEARAAFKILFRLMRGVMRRL